MSGSALPFSQIDVSRVRDELNVSATDRPPKASKGGASEGIRDRHGGASDPVTSTTALER